MKRSVLKVSRRVSVLAVAGMLCLPVQGFGASPDSIASGDIKEADGTSGQDTNTGAGIKTGHIQDGAVTDEKIAGPISASKISEGVFQKKYGNLIVVAKSGGDFTDPISAINSITNASSTNPYLIKIMPGVYNLPNPLYMKEFVNIEGSGENVTKITYQPPYSAMPDDNKMGTVYGASNAELRNLTVESVDDIGYWPSAAICNRNASPRIINVTAVSTGSPTGNYGILNDHSSAVITNSTLFAKGRTSNGVYNQYSSPIITNTKISAEVINTFGITSSTGIGNYQSTPFISNVSVTATGGTSGNRSILNTDPQYVVVLFNVIASGTDDPSPLISGGKCLNVYDGNYNPVICQ